MTQKMGKTPTILHRLLTDDVPSLSFYIASL